MFRSALRPTAATARILSSRSASSASSTPVAAPNSPSQPAVPSTPVLTSLNGLPAVHLGRTAYIYQPSRNAMQSGSNKTRSWRIDFGARETWENPLMGWASSADSLSNLQLQFDSMEQAVAFADRQGWKPSVRVKPAHVIPPKSYGVNFHWSKRTRVSTK